MPAAINASDASLHAFIALINLNVLIQSSEAGAIDNSARDKLEILMHSSALPMTTRARVGAIFRVTSGNFLEQFDFFLFGFYATYIAHFSPPAANSRR